MINSVGHHVRTEAQSQQHLNVVGVHGVILGTGVRAKDGDWTGLLPRLAAALNDASATSFPGLNLKRVATLHFLTINTQRLTWPNSN